MKARFCHSENVGNLIEKRRLVSTLNRYVAIIEGPCVPVELDDGILHGELHSLVDPSYSDKPLPKLA